MPKAFHFLLSWVMHWVPIYQPKKYRKSRWWAAKGSGRRQARKTALEMGKFLILSNESEKWIAIKIKFVSFQEGARAAAERKKKSVKEKEGTARVQGCLSIFSFSLALLASVEQTLKQQRTTAVICCRKRPLTCWDFSSLEAAKCRSSSIKCSYAYKMTEIVVCIFS